VNFVLSIESFDEHVGGALNLINLCLRSPRAQPAMFYFSSSVSCRQGGPEVTCAEDFPLSPSTAARTGYARSKWVTEKLCQRAAANNTDMRIGVLRIGQMTGDSAQSVIINRLMVPQVLIMFFLSVAFGMKLNVCTSLSS
jgi:thioester reductase-like protein